MPGTVAKLDFALSGAAVVPRRAATPADLRGRIHIGPTIDYLERAFDASKYGEISPEPYLDVAFPSLLDPSLAPPGRHVMSVYMQFAPFKLANGRAWSTMRDTLATTVLRTLGALRARHRPAGRGPAQVLTPDDLETTYGLTGGHILHGEPSLDQLFTMRPVLGWAQYRTPIDGLFLCGAGTHPGGGLTAASGHNAAREIVRDAQDAGAPRPPERTRARCGRASRLVLAVARRRACSPRRPGSRPRAGAVRLLASAAQPQQAAIERRFLGLPSADRIRDAHRFFAGEPHIAGSPRDRELAEDVRDRFTASGLEEVAITTHEVLLPWPEETTVEMVAPRAWRASMREEPIAGDAYTAGAAGAAGPPLSRLLGVGRSHRAGRLRRQRQSGRLRRARERWASTSGADRRSSATRCPTAIAASRR